MAKSFLESLEDPKQPLLAPNLWSLKKTGLILPKNRLRAFTKLIVHVNIFYFVMTEFIEAYFVRANLNLVITNIKIAMLSFAGLIKIISFVFFQKSWHQIFDYITEADQFERNNHDEVKQNIINNYTRYCRKMTYFYWFLMLTTHLTAVFQPLVLFVTSDVYRENYRNGTVSFPHIFSSWTPFNKEISPACWFVVAWHYLVSVSGASVLAAYDASMVVLMAFFGGKLDLLRERCKEMFGKKGQKLNNTEYEANLRHLHGMYIELLKHARLLNTLLSPVMFFYVILCTLMLCSSLFQLTTETDFFQKLLCAEYLIFGIAQLFLVCLPSNSCYIKGQDVAMGPYESEWWDSTATIRQKKDVLLLCGLLRQENQFTAGPFTNLNLATFVSILKGAYSYYTLLRD